MANIAYMKDAGLMCVEMNMKCSKRADYSPEERRRYVQQAQAQIELLYCLDLITLSESGELNKMLYKNEEI